MVLATSSYYKRTPELCSIKQKVMYSSSKKAFQSKLPGSKLVDAFDTSDLDYSTITDRLLHSFLC